MLYKCRFFYFGRVRRGESGFPIIIGTQQVLALPSSGCGLSTSIPHAKRKQELFDRLIKKVIEKIRFYQRFRFSESVKSAYIFDADKTDLLRKNADKNGFDLQSRFENLQFVPLGTKYW